MVTSLERASAWPELPWRAWEPTITTLHLWTQVVGKVQLALAPPLNHWWHVTFRVTPRGLTTGVIPYGQRSFEVVFDLIDHRVTVTGDGGARFDLALEPMTVAAFHEAFMTGLHGLGIDVPIWTTPVEVPDPIPFERDTVHASYERDHVRALLGGLQQADRVLRRFRSGFIGKASPVHFFWGSFDLATTRYSGRTAPRHPGGALNCPDWVMEEAYSREESSAGWWPGSTVGPAFYAYGYPEPAGYASAPVEPAGAFYDATLGEFTLPYDAIRDLPDPDAAVEAFLQTTYVAEADLAHWDRATLEPVGPVDGQPRRPWSLTTPDERS